MEGQDFLSSEQEEEYSSMIDTMNTFIHHCEEIIAIHSERGDNDSEVIQTLKTAMNGALEASRTLQDCIDISTNTYASNENIIT